MRERTMERWRAVARYCYDYTIQVAHLSEIIVAIRASLNAHDGQINPPPKATTIFNTPTVMYVKILRIY